MSRLVFAFVLLFASAAWAAPFEDVLPDLRTGYGMQRAWSGDGSCYARADGAPQGPVFPGAATGFYLVRCRLSGWMPPLWSCEPWAPGLGDLWAQDWEPDARCDNLPAPLMPPGPVF